MKKVKRFIDHIHKIITNQVADSWHQVVKHSLEYSTIIPYLEGIVISAWWCHPQEPRNQWWNQWHHLPSSMYYFEKAFSITSFISLWHQNIPDRYKCIGILIGKRYAMNEITNINLEEIILRWNGFNRCCKQLQM